VVRWRLIDLAQWIFEEFRITIVNRVWTPRVMQAAFRGYRMWSGAVVCSASKSDGSHAAGLYGDTQTGS